MGVVHGHMEGAAGGPDFPQVLGIEGRREGGGQRQLRGVGRSGAQHRQPIPTGEARPPNRVLCRPRPVQGDRGVFPPPEESTMFRRFVFLGAGAIGAGIGAMLALRGQPVLLVFLRHLG